MLSQSTNDRNRDVAYLRLRARFPAWEEVRDAPPPRSRRRSSPAACTARSPSGSSRSCARCRTRPTCSFLGELPVAEARDYLTALPGVGRKTAACVLLFAFGLPDVPVDTHVSRVGHAARAVPPRRPVRGAARRDAARSRRAGGELELHVNLLRHGRRTCHAQRPACGDCALLRMCPYGRDLAALESQPT